MNFPIVLIHFSPLKSGQPLYSGQISWSQCVLYKEVPLYYIYMILVMNVQGDYPVTQLQYHVSLQGKMAAGSSVTNGRIFAPYRAIGLCCNHVPMCMYARGDSILVATSVGKAHHVYNVSFK